MREVQLTPIPGAKMQHDPETGDRIIRVATCGVCGRSWNDAAISDRTPAPSGRCPFEAKHDEDDAPEPSAGAFRAAGLVADAIPAGLDAVAEVIDRESGLAEAREALREAIETCAAMDIGEPGEGDPLARWRTALAKIEGRAERRYTVDGTDENGALTGDGDRPPFRVFDAERQDWIGEPYQDRAKAEVEAARLNVAEGRAEP